MNLFISQTLRVGTLTSVPTLLPSVGSVLFFRYHSIYMKQYLDNDIMIKLFLQFAPNL